MTKETRSIGRPRKSDKAKKSAKIFINMTEEQKSKLIKKAEKERSGCRSENSGLYVPEFL